MGIDMAIRQDHELHRRRGKRNAALGVLLGGFVILLFAITVVKMGNGAALEAFDHSLRPSLVGADE